MKTKSIFIVASILLAIVFSYAQVPQLINYQGKLMDATGNPVTGTVSIVFSIYSTETGGTALWSETQNVTVTDGLFNVLLGSVTPIPFTVFDEDVTYLELKVGSDPAMTPRQRLVSVGYAIRANDADKLGGRKASEFVKSVDGITPKTGNIDLVEGSNITIESDPQNKTITISSAGGGGGGGLTLPYTGTIGSSATAFSVTNTGSGRAGYFKVNKYDNTYQAIYCESGGIGQAGYFRISNANNNSEVLAAVTQGNGPALSGHTMGSGSAVYGKTDGTGEAGHFEINNSSNSTYALYGITNGTGSGVYGKHSDSGNFGYLGGSSRAVFGSSALGIGVYGISANSTGVKGWSTNGNGVDGFSSYGTAVSGTVSGGGGQGVYGQHSSSGNYGSLGGASKGVSGYSESGTGVYGTSSTGNAVWGECTGNGHGVHGYCRSGVGVSGYSGEGIGVKGESISGTAVSAEGDLYVSGAYRGNITSSSGSDGAPFPRPAYDSGWIPIERGQGIDLTHNIGLPVENYFVDVQLKDLSVYEYGINNFGVGGDYTTAFGASDMGVFWKNLTSTTIRVLRGQDAWFGGEVRIRIWVYR